MAENALNVFIQEAKADGKSIVCDDKFKNWLTEPIQQIRKMRMDPYDAPNYATAFLWTNNPSCVKMTPAMARRTMAQEISAAKVDDKEYFENCWALAQDGTAIQAIFDYLITLDVSQFTGEVVPQTAFMKKMKADSLTMVQQYVVDLCNGDRPNIECDHGNVASSAKSIYDDYRSYCQENGIQSKYVVIAKNFKSELESLDIEHKQIRLDGARPWCFVIDADATEKVLQKLQKDRDWKLLRVVPAEDTEMEQD